MNNIKDKLADMKKSQVWLLQELRKRGVEVQPPQLCNIINGVYTYPKSKKVLQECEKIIKEFESVTLESHST